MHNIVIIGKRFDQNAWLSIKKGYHQEGDQKTAACKFKRRGDQAGPSTASAT
jgi:hypothetical protein